MLSHMFNLLLIQMHIKFLSFSYAICYNINYFNEMTRDIFVHSQEVYTQSCPDPPLYLNPHVLILVTMLKLKLQ